MKPLLSVIAIVSMVLLSFNAHSKLSANGKSPNGVSVTSVHPTVDLRALAQAPLVKAD